MLDSVYVTCTCRSTRCWILCTHDVEACNFERAVPAMAVNCPVCGEPCDGLDVHMTTGCGAIFDEYMAMQAMQQQAMGEAYNKAKAASRKRTRMELFQDNLKDDDGARPAHVSSGSTVRCRPSPPVAARRLLWN